MNEEEREKRTKETAILLKRIAVSCCFMAIKNSRIGPKSKKRTLNPKQIGSSVTLAEAEGFEPPGAFAQTVFKTASL